MKMWESQSSIWLEILLCCLCRPRATNLQSAKQHFQLMVQCYSRRMNAIRLWYGIRLTIEHCVAIHEAISLYQILFILLSARHQMETSLHISTPTGYISMTSGVRDVV